jgi:hypothetical protein
MSSDNGDILQGYNGDKVDLNSIMSQPLPISRSKRIHRKMSKGDIKSYSFPTIASVLRAIPEEVLKQAKDPIRRQKGIAQLIDIHHFRMHAPISTGPHIRRHSDCVEHIPSPDQ